MSHFTSLNRQFVSNFKVSDLVTKSKRDLILSILRSTTTKREAKNFLEKYQDQFDLTATSFHEVNLPKWSTTPGKQALIEKHLTRGKSGFQAKMRSLQQNQSAPLRVALFKISMADISNEHLGGITETLNRLVQLGVSPIIVCGQDDMTEHSFKLISSFLSEHAERLLLLLLNKVKSGLDLIPTNLTRSLFIEEIRESGGKARIDSLELLLIPLLQGIVPIIIPAIFNASDGSQRFLEPKDALLTICSELLEIPDVLSIEKIIYIDSLGGIPSIERNQTSHVFINLSQEFSDIVSELYIGHLEPKMRESHMSNLESMNRILHLVAQKTGSNSATGIITTPLVMSVNDDQLNPVVYNVLTDRPIISSSLPSALQRTPQVSTSIIKNGFQVTVLDQDSYHEKMLHLIADSFGKSLNTEEYLARINDSLATLIIVGDYEGAAIITWEYLSNGNKVAYLDKFAIAKRNQGIPSLADVIFKLITQSHQAELLWRSRANNPVNKWYFERCRGSVNIKSSPWKFFYTGEIYNRRMGTKIDGTEQRGIDITEKLHLYSELVENLEPSFK
ncbi:DUF619-domain-containing protein [Metschnikowia bicuspidata var. bicuspidata NRRL YB-4993]|uniref:Amino-acid acetyltransferase, mitochondrial n=1 Tax=Metschnikowia bicuspidata var. bicuspidata NRRL YB-4993 TaxID=869754 RepID=A0A1A0H9I8_9ASCO|nr:DUF619-domain-containing protein [Metschnikowia bicuspidata var. bicuspidata NRRL YB-4993]OBA20552.1 DUF619-domain-containing protein [Metschnikowia bicuspidata var. bicuspidata NRRL YB-4993]